MRIVMWGDLGATGFGTVTEDLGRALIDLGHDLRFLSLNEAGLTAAEPFASRLLLAETWLGPDIDFLKPAEQRDEFRKRLAAIFTAGVEGWTPEAAIVMGDPAAIIASGVAEVIPQGFPAVHYVPVEGVGLPPSWRNIWYPRSALHPVAMCDFGAAELAKILGERPPFIYHGVDTEAFYPATRERPIVLPIEKDLVVIRNKAEAKAAFGFRPEHLIFFRADRNMPRKRYGSMLRAVAPVMERHLAFMLMHCLTVDLGGNLDDFRSFHRPDVQARMLTTGFHDRGKVIDRRLLNAWYNAADITLSTGAEGFGLTIAESLAAGTPVIGMDFSSVPEVIGPAGVLVPPAYLVENMYSYFWAGVDEPQFTKALEFLATHKTRRLELGKIGPRYVREKFSWPMVASRFVNELGPLVGNAGRNAVLLPIVSGRKSIDLASVGNGQPLADGAATDSSSLLVGA